MTSPRVAAAIAKRSDVALQIVVDRQGVQIGLVPHAAQQIAYAPGAVADGVARCAAGTHWLTIIARRHRRSGSACRAAGRYAAVSSSCCAASNWCQKSKATRGAAARGATRGSVRRTRAACRESFACRPLDGFELPARQSRPGARRSTTTASISAADVERILSRNRTPAPSIVAGTAVAAKASTGTCM